MKEKYMKRAIELADKGKGFVNPNPVHYLCFMEEWILKK